MSSTPAPKSKKLCSYFVKKGSCAYGDQCTKLHASSPRPSTNAGARQARRPNSSVASPSPRYPATTVASSLAGSLINRSPTPPDQETLGQSEASRSTARVRSVKQDMDICNFYAIGICEGGDECEFRHEGPTEPSQVTDRAPTSPPETSLPTRVCRHYKKGKCRDGDACKFSHRLDKYDRLSAPSPIPKASPQKPQPTITRDKEPPPQARPVSHSPVLEPTPSARGVGLGSKSTALKDAATPPESEDEDQFADADDDDEEASSDIYTSIMKPQTPAPLHRRTRSPGLSPYQRIYPVVASPKPIPHVVDIVPHWSQFADPKAEGDIPFCKQLAQNQCSLGEQCRFRHSLTIDEYAMLFKDLQPNMWTISRAEGYQTISSPHTTDMVSPTPVRTSTKMAAQSSRRPAPAKKPCDYWPIGRCINGGKCPFAHIGTPPNESATQPRKSTAICRNLQYDGECKYGPSCFYSHDLHSGSGDQGGDQQEDSGWGVTTNDNDWAEDSPSQHVEESATSGWDAAPADDGNEWGASPPDANSGRGRIADDKNGWGAPPESRTNDGWSASGSSSRMRTRPGSRLCFDFSKGRCLRTSCRFSHDLSGGGESGQRSGRDSGLSGSGSYAMERRRGPCYDYQRGGCTRGDRCRYSHDDEPVAQNATAASGWDDQPTDDPVDESWGQTGTRDEGRGQVWAEDTGGRPASTEGASGQIEGLEDVEDTGGVLQNNDDSWGQQGEEGNDGWADIPPEDREVVTKIRKPCKAFGQGTCMRGDSCKYLHDLPEDQVRYHREQDADPELQEQVEESLDNTEETSHQVEEAAEEEFVEDLVDPEVPNPEPELDPEPDINLERFMYHCTVSFNNRCSPHSVMTAADSCEIILSNLPPDSTASEIHDLAARFGAVKDLAFRGEVADSATVCIKFAKGEDATAAVKQLNDQKFGPKLISAKLDSRTPVFARSPLHSQMLMVSWPGATLIAWSYYPSITTAKAVAAKLDKTMFKDRKIGASFERPGKKGPYAIRLTGLPPSASKGDLDSFCVDPTPNLTTLGEPSYNQSPENSIRKELKGYGRVEDFRICPHNGGTFRTVAYVTMQTYSAAEEAAKALNKSTPDYLGKATLEVQHIYLASYKVLPDIFECVRDRIGVIREKHKDRCTILDDFDGYTHNVELRSSIDESTSFADANGELGGLIDGSLVLDESGGQLWDPYLELPSSAKAIDKINDPNTDVPCFVHCDNRLRCVRVYGSIDGQARGRKTLLKILKKVSEQCHEIELDREAQIAGLVDGGFVQLQRNLGGNKVSLSIVDARLTIRGSTEDLEAANGVVSALAISASSSASGPTIKTNLCPFCERVPVSPVKLTCRHAYCQACLQFALASTAKGDFSAHSPFFACIAPLRSNSNAQGDISSSGPDAVVQRCKAPLSYVVVRDNLATAQETTYLKTLFSMFVRSSAGRFFFCPTPDCPAVHRAGEEGIVVRCPGCASDVCPKCSRRIHDASLCEA